MSLNLFKKWKGGNLMAEVKLQELTPEFAESLSKAFAVSGLQMDKATSAVIYKVTTKFLEKGTSFSLKDAQLCVEEITKDARYAPQQAK